MSLSDAFNSLNEEEQPEVVTVELISLAGIQEVEVTAGQTVAEFKTANGLSSTDKVVDEETNIILPNNFVIEEDMSLVVSASKQNG